MRLRGLAVALAALAAAALVAGAVSFLARDSDDQPSPPPVERLAADMVAAGAPGALVVVVEEGSGAARAAAGVADREAERVLRAGDRFRVGSVTKTFVATVVLQLVGEGALRLDDTVEHWLPGMIRGGHAITIRHLLSHTSGLADYVEDPAVFRPYRRDPLHTWEPRALVDLALARPRAHARPGDFTYASTNYLLLGLIVDAATGRALGRELRERIFVPLGLADTAFVPLRPREPYVHGYRAPSHRGIVTGPPQDTGGVASWAWAAGAIVSSADDLTRFFAALLGGELLEPAQLRQMITLVRAGAYRYGLGLAVYPTPCGPAWGHTGNIAGYVTVVWNTEDASRQIVLMANTYPLPPELERAVRRAQVAAFCGRS